MGLFGRFAECCARTGLNLQTIIKIMLAVAALLVASLMALMYWLLGAAGAVAVVVVLCTGAYWHFGWLLASDRVPKGLYSDPQQPGTVRFVCVSDTHNKHKYLDIPHGDVLVCSGDFTRRGTPKVWHRFAIAHRPVGVAELSPPCLLGVLH